MSFAYSVAIKLTVANLASQGVRMLAKDLLAAHGSAVSLGDKLKALKMIAVGYGMEKAGQGMLGFMGKAIDASKEYTRQLSLMNAAGMSHLEVARATAAAWQTSRDVVTTSAAENLKAIRELRSVFGAGGMGEAYRILPTVQRTKSILDALTGRENEGVAFDMVKAIELRTPGLMSSARMQSNADLMARALMAMGGTLNAHDFHMTLKQSKTAAFGLSDDFVYNYLPTLIQEVKTGASGSGSTAGTALMSTYSAIIGGVLKKSAIPLWEAMGLISPSSVVKNSTGALQLKPGAVRGSALFQSNPYAWANEVLAPAIAAYGKSHGLNREQVISGMFGNRNAQWLMNTLIAKAPQFERDRKLIESGGNSYQTYQRLLKTNPQLAGTAMHNQWQNVLSILGYQVLPKLIPWMIKFANGLDRIGQFMERHPNLTAGLAIGLLGVGSALIVVGKALMTIGIMKFLGMGPMIGGLMRAIGTGIMFLGRALFANPIGLVLLAIGVAAYEVYQHWDWISKKLSTVWTFLKSSFFGFINGLIDLANHIPFVHLNHIGGGAPQSSYVPPAHKMEQRGGDVYLDGKKVGKALSPYLTGHFANDMSRPNRGTSVFDGTRGPLRPATAR
jgi:hypothetical protein